MSEEPNLEAIRKALENGGQPNTGDIIEMMQIPSQKDIESMKQRSKKMEGEYNTQHRDDQLSPERAAMSLNALQAVDTDGNKTITAQEYQANREKAKEHLREDAKVQLEADPRAFAYATQAAQMAAIYIPAGSNLMDGAGGYKAEAGALKLMLQDAAAINNELLGSIPNKPATGRAK